MVPAIRDAISNAQDAATAPAASEPDVIEQISKLKQLHKAGVLTDDESTSKKSELLGRL